MSLTPKRGGKIPQYKYPKKPTTHFTLDGQRRYCTNRPKGKDELTRIWSEVNCKRCLEKGEPESPLSPEMKEAIDKFRKERSDK